MPQQSSQNNRRRRWRRELHLVPEARRSEAARSFKCGYRLDPRFQLVLFSSSCDNVMCLGNLLVLLISSSDIWNKYTLYNLCTFLFSKSAGAIQFNNLHFSPCRCHSTKCMLFGVNLLKASCQVSDSFTHGAGLADHNRFFSSSRLRPKTPLNHPVNKVLHRPAPGRWGAPARPPWEAAGGGCFSDWGERD